MHIHVHISKTSICTTQKFLPLPPNFITKFMCFKFPVLLHFKCSESPDTRAIVPSQLVTTEIVTSCKAVRVNSFDKPLPIKLRLLSFSEIDMRKLFNVAFVTTYFIGCTINFDFLSSSWPRRWCTSRHCIKSSFISLVQSLH